MSWKYNWKILMPKIKELQAKKYNTTAIARYVGIPEPTLRWHLKNRAGIQKNEEYYGMPTRSYLTSKGRFPQEHIDAMLAQRKPDARTYTQKFFGDPRPGESALDRKQGTP